MTNSQRKQTRFRQSRPSRHSGVPRKWRYSSDAIVANRAWAVTRVLALNGDHALVVPLTSSIADALYIDRTDANCDHMSYFKSASASHVTAAAQFARAKLAY